MVTYHTAKNLKEKSGCDKNKSYFFLPEGRLEYLFGTNILIPLIF